MLIPISAVHWLTFHGLVTVAAVLFYVITSHVMHQRRNPAAAIAWILFILLVPYLALPAYIAFGSRKQQRPRLPAPQASRPLASSPGDWAGETIAALGQPAPAAYRELNLHRDGSAARGALTATIAGAMQSIDICTFILGRDAIGAAVIEQLCQKAHGGVRVRLLLDGLGSLMAGRPDLKPLREAGATCVLFVPPLRSPFKGRTNLRDHRKMVVADAGQEGERLWCGGRNLAAEYFEGRDGTPAWRDLSFDLRGPLVGQAGALFEHDWGFANRLPMLLPPSLPLASSIESRPSEVSAQVLASGPDQVDDTVYELLVTAAYRAQHRIAMITPYFVPDTALLMALCLAARRGVQVDLVLPARSNHRLSDFARSRALRSLAGAGARVWLAPGMLHAKLVVVDEVLALAGSANLDSRSLFLNYELMVAFRHRDDVKRFAAWFERERSGARAYAAKAPGLVRDIAEGMLLWLGFQL